MNLNGIGSYNNTASTAASSTAQKTSSTEAASTSSATTDNDGVIYEQSETSSSKTTYSRNQTVIDQLKADANARTASLKSLVESMFTKQGKTYNDSNFWNMIREGNYTVDPEVAAKAKEDIGEDGYWGVKQTSERMVSFAKALTGGDPSKVESMRDAIKKGYDAAAKVWGGKLPEISQKTYDATMKALDEWAKEGK